VQKSHFFIGKAWAKIDNQAPATDYRKGYVGMEKQGGNKKPLPYKNSGHFAGFYYIFWGAQGRRMIIRLWPNILGGRMEPYLTIYEVAEILKLSVQTVRRYVMKREIPCHKIFRAVRFKPSEIQS
jgi:excisionase family DNA binding protein